MSAWTKSELLKFKKKIQEAYFSGSQSVSYRDRRVEFRSLDDFNRIIAKIDEEIDGKPARRRIRPVYDSGL